LARKSKNEAKNAVKRWFAADAGRFPIFLIFFEKSA